MKKVGQYSWDLHTHLYLPFGEWFRKALSASRFLFLRKSRSTICQQLSGYYKHYLSEMSHCTFNYNLLLLSFKHTCCLSLRISSATTSTSVKFSSIRCAVSSMLESVCCALEKHPRLLRETSSVRFQFRLPAATQQFPPLTSTT